MPSLSDLIEAKIAEAGGLTKLSKQVGISLTYLSKIRHGHISGCSDELLAKLGIVRVTDYQFSSDIPQGVFYSKASNTFFDAKGKEMPHSFFVSWFGHRLLFPQHNKEL